MYSLHYIYSRCQWPLWRFESQSFGASGGKIPSLRWNQKSNLVNIWSIWSIFSILALQVKITIITVTFGVATPAPPAVETTPTTVVTRDPSKIHNCLIAMQSKLIFLTLNERPMQIRTSKKEVWGNVSIREWLTDQNLCKALGNINSAFLDA